MEMSTDDKGGISRREMMTGLGLGAGAGLVLAAGLPLTAAAGPVSNHVPAWMPLPKSLGPAIPNLAYVGVDASAFLDESGARYMQGGQSGGTGGGKLLAPLSLPVGSIIRQINVGVQATASSPFEVQIRENPFGAAWDAEPVVKGAVSGTGAANQVTSVTSNLATPIVVAHAATYQLAINANPGTTIRGATVGYLPPTAGFVPFDGATPRVIDTRASGDRLTFQEEITINLGNPGVRGALINLTVTETQNGGFVAAFAADIAYPGNSSVNYTATGQTVANGVVSAVAPDGTIKLRGGGPLGSCHVIVDRLGWFV
jgi:hypothetical protein